MRVSGWSEAAAARLKVEVKAYGSQAAVAKEAGISRPSLVEILAGRAVPTVGTLDSLCNVLGTTAGDVIGLQGVRESRQAFGHFPREMESIPALNVKACAGDGSFAFGEELGPGPFQFATDWLRRQFGQTKSLRMIQITGDSQEPDLRDGDWVMIDEAKNKVENGLHVIRLDDCLMIKRLQREGHFLQLISRNPIYAPTAIDLSKEEDRLTVIGKAVYMFKGI